LLLADAELVLLRACSLACRILREMVMRHGDRKWAVISQSLPGRVGKQCRERWTNHLRPDLKVHILFPDRSICPRLVRFLGWIDLDAWKLEFDLCAAFAFNFYV